eukprot:16131951-Heterocapsa_arctica.AAC.1
MQLQSGKVANLSTAARAWKSVAGLCQRAMASSRSIAQGGQGWQKLNRTRRLLCEATEVDLSDIPGNLQHWTWKSLAAHLCSGVLDTCQMITDLISE